MAHWFGSDPAALNFHVNFLLEHVFHYFFLFLRKKEEKTWTTKLKTDDAYIITGSFRRPFCGEYVLFKLYGVARKDERNCFFFSSSKKRAELQISCLSAAALAAGGHGSGPSSSLIGSLTL
jgi:hypothetical protein